MRRQRTAGALAGMLLVSSLAAGAQDLRPPAPLEPLTVQRYPLEARRLGIEGRSLVGALINEDGTVVRVELLKSSGFNALDLEAMRVVHRARFTPATVGGVARSLWVRVPIRFALEGQPPSQVPVDAVPLASQGPQVSDGAEPVVISVAPDGLVYVGSEPLGLEDLRPRLSALAASQPLIVHIRADEEAHYGRVARVIAAAQSAGASAVRFLVAPPK